LKRIGLEAGPLSQWLFSALAEAELPVVCVETRHMQAVLKAQINKTDRNDARGIAQMMRVGLYRPVHVKTLRSQKLRMLLTGAVFGLTCSKYQSGEIDRSGRISRCGDEIAHADDANDPSGRAVAFAAGKTAVCLCHVPAKWCLERSIPAASRRAAKPRNGQSTSSASARRLCAVRKRALAVAARNAGRIAFCWCATSMA